MGEQIDTDNPRRPQRWLVAAVTTVTAWLVAFVVVMALLTLFREQLASLPVALRALVISGVLVTLMVNLVMPALGGAVVRMLVSRTRPRLAGGPGQSGIRAPQPQLRTVGPNDAGTAPGSVPRAPAPPSPNKSMRVHRPDRGDPRETANDQR
jgi:hypothetical protein